MGYYNEAGPENVSVIISFNVFENNLSIALERIIPSGKDLRGLCPAVRHHSHRSAKKSFNLT